MYLTEDQITKFQTLYLDRFGKKISRAEALDKGVKLVGLMKLICEPEITP